jgi:hypothetical protein
MMYASVLNVVLGCFLVRAQKRVPRILQVTASWAIIVGPLLLMASFLFEPYRVDLERPLSRFANMLAFGGTFLYFLAHMAERKGRSVQEVRARPV